MAKWKELPINRAEVFEEMVLADTTVNMVEKPPHYQSSIECIDAMAAMSKGTTLEAHASYCWQNAFKYLWRWPYKHSSTAGRITDLKKCRWYLDRLIKELDT